MSDFKKASGTKQSENVQAHIVYSGMVQGVGFRYTAHRIAVSLELCGWVKNLADGRVEILIEGKKEKVEAFMREMGSHFGSYIRNKDLTFQNSLAEFKDFQVIV